ncbi:MAG TPA: hypothetical protein VHX14_00175 [Thermoanaerobaculia bacterium]|jgi:hypothetical protein|nr:hypothetical protein [Thermoanaerobaculia bacterium]
MHPLRAAPRYLRAIESTAELLTKLRIESMFVGSVARAAWIGGTVGGMIDGGSIDVLALMQPQQQNQVAMMANNRGFRVDRDEIEQTEELDLVPLTWVDEEGDVRVHVLVASNALYARMFASARTIDLRGRDIRVPAAEDLALLLSMSDELDDVRVLAAGDSFDRSAFNEKLVSIGLRERVL